MTPFAEMRLAVLATKRRNAPADQPAAPLNADGIQEQIALVDGLADVLAALHSLPKKRNGCCA